MAIYDATGSRKVEYGYDAFGNCKVVYANNSDLANNNPIRYRSYYYDRETKLYYLHARYYNPEWRRFISPAEASSLDPSSINGLNLYSFAGNNPVGITYSSSSVSGLISGVSVGSIALGSVSNVGNIGGNSSSRLTTLPAVPNALKHISKANDVFSSVSHSFMIGNYLFGNGRLHTLSYLDDMRMIGVNPTRGLSSLSKASWLNKLGYGFSAIDGAITIYNNLQQGNSWEQALLDGALSFGKSAVSAWTGGFVATNVGGLFGAALGSIIPIPGVGTFAGFVIGTGVGVVASWFVDDILGLLKDGIVDLIFD